MTKFWISVFTSQLSNIDNVTVLMLRYARLRLQQQILSLKPAHNYFITPQCITDSRSQRLQLPRDLHKAEISLTHAYRTTVANTRFLQTGQPHFILYSNSHLSNDFYYYRTDSRLWYDRRKYKIPQKGQAYQKSCLLASLSNPIQSKKFIYIQAHPNKLPPNGGNNKG